jgi:hypothetical protein
MVGVGRVFDLYRTGATDADDEVGLTFDPETLRATSEPYVNMRFAMADAVARGLVAEPTAEAVLATAKALFFPYRTYANVATILKPVLPPEEHRRFVACTGGADRLDQKRLDALELLRRMNEDEHRHEARDKILPGPFRPPS